MTLARRSFLSLSALTCVLAGCGFKLRETPHFAFQTFFSALPENSQIGVKLRRQLEASGQVEFIRDPREVERAQVIFDQLGELREKVVVARTTTGTIREYQLRLRYRFRLRTQAGKELIPDTEMVLTRDINYNETAALSTESQEGLLYRDMENDLVQQLLRRFAAIREL